MKKIIRLTESDIYNIVKKVILEQKKIDLTKNNVSEFCSPLKVSKDIIDTKIQELKKELPIALDKKKKALSKKIGITKIIDIENLFTKIQNTIFDMSIKHIYSNFGYQQYNDEVEKDKFYKLLYSELYQQLEGNKIKKMLLKTLITKNNSNNIKSNVSLIIYEINNLVTYFLTVLPNIYIMKIRTKYYETAPICNDAIVVVDDSYNILPKNKQYHPKTPIFEVETTYSDSKKLIKPYIDNINKIIDSYA